MATAGVALTLGGGTAIRSFAAPDSRLAWLATPTPASDRIVVILRLYGGNDGLNTVVPIHDDEYYRIRRDTAQVDLSIAPERTLPIPGHPDLGLHPALAPLAELYAEDKVAIVQGVGYPNMDLSHFRGLDIWLSASDANVFDRTGWTARTLERLYPDYPDVLPDAPYAIELGAIIGRSLEGSKGSMGYVFDRFLRQPDGIGPVGPDGARSRYLETMVLEYLRQSDRFSRTLDQAMARIPAQPVNHYYADGNGPLASSLKNVARLIRSGLSTRFYIVHSGQFDTHHRQQEVHHQQLDELSTNILAFQREIEEAGLADRVVVMPMSEFGRRIEPTESGTDHGTAAPVFVIGTQVRGGMYGITPRVDELDANDNLLWHVDFRQIYASVLSQWLEIPAPDIDGHILPRMFEQLPLFRTVTSNLHTSAVAGAVPSVYPLPASDALTVTLPPEVVWDDEVSLSFHAMSGLCFLRTTVGRDGHVVRTSVRSLPSGLYTIVVTDGRSRRSIPCLVQR